MTDPDDALNDPNTNVSKLYVVTMPDGSKWGVPVMFIARNRAAYYARLDKVSFNASLLEDTIPLFNRDEFEIRDWAQNNMDWDDIRNVAKPVEPSEELDFQEGWTSGEVELQ